MDQIIEVSKKPGKYTVGLHQENICREQKKTPESDQESVIFVPRNKVRLNENGNNFKFCVCSLVFFFCWLGFAGPKMIPQQSVQIEKIIDFGDPRRFSAINPRFLR